MILRRSFGRTGFESSRVLFGAAALAGMKPARVEATLSLLERYGVNHIDTAASYGDSELNLAGWLREKRADVFLATKTGARDGAGARASLEKSLERMGVDSVDCIQLHNLTDESGWSEAMSPGGAVEALIQARDEGLVRFLGVTGHGTFAPAMHMRSLEEYEFASVLVPYNYAMMAQPEYVEDFEALAEICRQRGVALQTIKSVARRRWQTQDGPKFSWYEPIRDIEALGRAVQWVLSREDVFLNSSSDGRILEETLRVADECGTSLPERPGDGAMLADRDALSIEPLFVRGVSDSI